MTVAWAQILFLLLQRDYTIVNALKSRINSQIFSKDWCSLKDVWEVLHVILEEVLRNIIFFLFFKRRGKGEEKGCSEGCSEHSTQCSITWTHDLTHSMWLRKHFTYLFLGISLWQEYLSYPHFTMKRVYILLRYLKPLFSFHPTSGFWGDNVSYRCYSRNSSGKSNFASSSWWPFLFNFITFHGNRETKRIRVTAEKQNIHPLHTSALEPTRTPAVL